MYITSTHKQGFTLIEILVVMAIGVMIAFATMGVMARGIPTLKRVRHNQRLHANAEFAANAFGYWVKQGQFLEVTGAETLRVRTPDGTEKIFAKDGTRLTLDGIAITSDDVEVNALTFIGLARSVQMTLTLDSRDSDASIFIQTSTAQRTPPL